MALPRVLITGAKGQVGGYLKDLDWSNFDMTAAGRQEFDLSDSSRLQSALKFYQPDVIINAAAYTAVDRAESEPELAHQVNAVAPGLMADYLASRNGLLVHYSTDYVFPGDAERPYSEDDPTGPTGVYGRTKLEGEKSIIGSGVDHLILRTSWVYAHRGHNFFLTMLRLGAERDRLNVVNDQYGTPTFALDLAEMTARMVERLSRCRDLQGIYHLGNGGVATWYEFARCIFRLAGNDTIDVAPVTTSEYPTPATRPAYSVLSKNRVASDFGLRIPLWEAGLERCFQLYQASQ